jgi:hypothetical protein
MCSFSSRITGCMYIIRWCRSMHRCQRVIHPHSYHLLTAYATAAAHWQPPLPPFCQARPWAAEASLCQRSWAANPRATCPSKHCCAPWFHNRPSILARLAHGSTGTCTLGRTAARYTASAPMQRVHCLREQSKHRSACAHSLAPAQLRLERVWTCVSSVCVNPARLRYLGRRCVTCDSAFSIIVM